MSAGRTFVDSNVLIYAYDVDSGAKRELAKAALRQLWESESGALSVQVLSEFYVNATRKIPHPISRGDARGAVGDYSGWCVEARPADIFVAFRIEDEARIGFWDALIVASALKCRAERILSEDFNAGQEIAGIRIENPFASLR
jgi:predicted nucleic acid-binding protein